MAGLDPAICRGTILVRLIAGSSPAMTETERPLWPCSGTPCANVRPSRVAHAMRVSERSPDQKPQRPPFRERASQRGLLAASICSIAAASNRISADFNNSAN